MVSTLQPSTDSFLRGGLELNDISTLKHDIDAIQSEGIGSGRGAVKTGTYIGKCTMWRCGKRILDEYPEMAEGKVHRGGRGVDALSFRSLGRELGRSDMTIKRWIDTVNKYGQSEEDAFPAIEEDAEIIADKWVEKQQPKLPPPVMALPDGKYSVIYADPPWKYTSGDQHTDVTQDTVIGTHYQSMTIPELCALPVIDLATDNSVLFLWVTSPLLDESFDIIDAWGFEYKTSIVWDKVKHNVGNYVSVRHEFLLICTRGSFTPTMEALKLEDSVQVVERTEHSTKPEAFRAIIEMLYPDEKYIELFARRRVDGWDTWGDEV